MTVEIDLDGELTVTRMRHLERVKSGLRGAQDPELRQQGPIYSRNRISDQDRGTTPEDLLARSRTPWRPAWIFVLIRAEKLLREQRSPNETDPVFLTHPDDEIRCFFVDWNP